MKFSYKVTEAEYLQAWRLGGKPRSAFQYVRFWFLFWFSVMVGLILLWSIVAATTPAISAKPGTHFSIVRVILLGLLFVAIWFCWIYLEFFFPKARMRRQFRKDPLMKGEFTVNVTPGSIFTQNSAGSSSQTGWDVYTHWRQRKRVIILAHQSGSFFTISIDMLPEKQRETLRDTLTLVLPQK